MKDCYCIVILGSNKSARKTEDVFPSITSAWKYLKDAMPLAYHKSKCLVCRDDVVCSCNFDSKNIIGKKIFLVSNIKE